MKIPTSLLRDTLEIAPYRGSSAYGPLFGDGVTVKARVEGRRRVVKTATGADLISSATAFVRPDVDVTPESRATWQGRPYTVLDVLPAQGLTDTSHLELLLGAA